MNAHGPLAAARYRPMLSSTLTAALRAAVTVTTTTTVKTATTVRTTTTVYRTKAAFLQRRAQNGHSGDARADDAGDDVISHNKQVANHKHCSNGRTPVAQHEQHVSPLPRLGLGSYHYVLVLHLQSHKKTLRPSC